MTIEQRLDRLERQNRFLKGTGAAVLLALMAVALMGAGGAIPDVIRAREFRVIGKDGKPYIAMGNVPEPVDLVRK